MTAEAGRVPTVVLVAHDVHNRGGMERVCAELLRRATGRYRFLVVSTHLAPELRPLVEWKRVPVPRRPVPLKFVTFFVLAGIRLARCASDLSHTVGAIVPNRVDVASVHLCHAGFVETVGTKIPPEGAHLRRLNTAIARGLGRTVERWCYKRRVGLLAAVSADVADEVKRHYPDVPVATTPNGVDTDHFRPDAGMRREMRTLHDVETREFVALFVGGDWSHKGLSHAIQGLAAAEKERPGSFRLWVVGGGDEARFGRIAESYGVRERVRFFGKQADVRSFYQAADAFVLPSRYEAFSLAMLEAAASGLPLICTPVHSARELVGKDEAGVLVEELPAGIGRALLRLASDPAGRSRMATSARERSERFTWERSVETVLEEYERLLAAKTNGSLR